MTRAAGRSFPVLWLVTVLLTVGCGPKSVQVGQEFPVPVMQKKDARVALRVSAAFANYRHSEELEGAGRWDIAIGQANTAMFGQLLDGMFTQSERLEGEQPAPEVDLVVTPELVDFQFSTPELSFTEFYEAWFRYQLRFHDGQGALLSEWPLTAYGRSEARFLGGSDALRDATEMALRDAAAGFAVRFARDAALQSHVER
jgi:hypothetical protein